MKQIPRISCKNSGSSSGETHLFGRDAWREGSSGRRRLQLLGATSNEGPGFLGERMAVAMAFSQFHLGELRDP